MPGRARAALRPVPFVVAAAALLAGLVALPAPSTSLSAEAAPVAPDAFFGTWSDGMSPTRERAAAEMDKQAAAGLGMIRQYVFWDRIETSPGTYDWSTTDRLVGDAAERGIRILPTLLYTPAFYTSKPAGSTSTKLFPPADPDTMGRFAAAMARRYGPNGSFWCPLPGDVVPGGVVPCEDDDYAIRAWEVWNEPDHPSWWKGAPNPAEYVPLLRSVHDHVKLVDLRAEIVLGALTNAGGGRPDAYLDALYDLGAQPYFDTLSINPYAKDVAGMISYVQGQRDIATRNGDGSKPIRVTEYGWATGGNSSAIVTTESCQAGLLHAGTRRLSELREELGITSIMQFQWHDVPTTSTLWPHYAGVVRVDDTAKPALAALTAAVAGRAAPEGADLTSACPADRRAIDGVRVDRTGGGTGTVTSSPAGVACGTDCVHDFAVATPVTLTATPAPGSVFVGWAGACSGTGACSFTTNATGKQVVALFESTGASACPTGSPSASASASASPTGSPATSGSPEPSASVDPSGSPEPSASVEPSASAEPSDSPEPSASAEPSDSPEPSTSAEPSDSPEPSSTPEPSESAAGRLMVVDASASPEVSASPEESSSPEASSSPDGSPSPEASSSPDASASPDASPSPSCASPDPSTSPEPSDSPDPSSSPDPSDSPDPSSSPDDSPSPSPSTSSVPATGGGGGGGNPEPTQAAAPSASASSSPSTTPSTSPSPEASPTLAPRAGSGYVALTSPTRVMDSRTGLGTTQGLRSGAVRLDLSGRLPVGATAAVLNVTVTNPTTTGFVVVYPDGTARPGTSNVNVVRGQTQANEVVVGVPASRQVVLFVDSTRAHLVADLVGYFTAADRPDLGRIVTQAPVRVLDSRDGTGTTQGRKRGEVVLDLNGLVPAGTTSVALNITVAGPDARGFVVAYPTGTRRPGTSNVNVERGQTQANEAVVRLGTGANAGKVSLYVDSTSAALIVDLVASVVPVDGAGSQRFTALAQPERVMDTRTGVGGTTGRRNGTTVLTLPTTAVPEGATGVVLNVTSTGASRTGYVAVFPTGSDVPGTSNVNFRAGANQANEVLTAVGDGRRITLLVGGSGTPLTHLVVDVVGYLTAS